MYSIYTIYIYVCIYVYIYLYIFFNFLFFQNGYQASNEFFPSSNWVQHVHQWLSMGNGLLSGIVSFSPAHPK